MEYILSFNSVKPADYALVGNAATNLLKLSSIGIKIPLGIVLKFTAFDDFLNHNNIDINNPNGLSEQIMNGAFPGALESELKEVYESLITGSDNDITLTNEKQMQQVIPSPSYDTNFISSRLAPITSYDELVSAIKNSWIKSVSTGALNEENNPGLNNYKVSLIICNYNDSEATVKAVVNSDENIELISYFGEFDRNVAGEDSFIVEKEFLRIKNSKVVFQDSKIVRRGKKFEREANKPTGSSQKIDDKKIMECARLAKKTFTNLQIPMELIYSVVGEDIQIICAHAQNQKIEKNLQAEETVENESAEPSEEKKNDFVLMNTEVSEISETEQVSASNEDHINIELGDFSNAEEELATEQSEEIDLSEFEGIQGGKEASEENENVQENSEVDSSEADERETVNDLEESDEDENLEFIMPNRKEDEN